jgi:hypothetical protein
MAAISSSWPMRGAVLLGCALALWATLAITVDRVFARRAPQVALGWNPWSADAATQRAELTLARGAGLAAMPAVRRDMTAVLRREPVNPPAARLLGLAYAAQRDEAQAERALRYAERMSRRDLPTQLALIESAVARGDIAVALTHYNRALVTNNRSRDLLLPILVAAADQPQVTGPLARALAARPRWWREFMDRFIHASTSPLALHTLSRAAGLAQRRTSDIWLVAAAQRRLIDLGAPARAADLYLRLRGRGGAPLAPIRNGGFEEAGGMEPFDWNLRDEPDLAAVRMPAPAGGTGNALFVQASNGRGGDVATQFLLLAPGRYRLTAVAGDVGGQDRLAIPRLVVRCAAGGRELLRAALPVTGARAGRMAADLAVPAGCAGQWLAVAGASPLDGSSQTPWIDDVAIRAAGGR